MVQRASASDRPSRRDRTAFPPRWPAPRRGLIRCLLVAGGAAWLGLASQPEPPRPAPPAEAPGPAARPDPAPAPAAPRQAWMLDPSPALDPALLTWRQAALDTVSGFTAPQPAEPAAPEAPSPVLTVAEASAEPSLAPDARLILQPVPLPVPRPAEFRIAARTPETPRLTARQTPRRSRGTQSTATAMADTRSFFEKLFGESPSPAQPALAYASVGSGRLDEAPRPPLGPSPFRPVEEATAVYDITAQTVTLPGGERLEAHSGLGQHMDDPRFVHLRMRGATPPGTYLLTEREALFHGVRAIRLNPVGGSGAIHGRNGILAHTYMLGPSGASNGCVSFKDYNRFLQAFLRGEVRRLVVVAGRG
ncbi:DUF2778 domain-containing protein [Methylobacterium sp. ID0610]|uniref:DUF2778 domain-containing protein n=1 Tax=Methylobacterium carpenticola TaxID=3344827 RepID=UPI0036BE0978